MHVHANRSRPPGRTIRLIRRAFGNALALLLIVPLVSTALAQEVGVDLRHIFDTGRNLGHMTASARHGVDADSIGTWAAQADAHWSSAFTEPVYALGITDSSEPVETARVMLGTVRADLTTFGAQCASRRVRSAPSIFRLGTLLDAAVVEAMVSDCLNCLKNVTWDAAHTLRTVAQGGFPQLDAYAKELGSLQEFVWSLSNLEQLESQRTEIADFLTHVTNAVHAELPAGHIGCMSDAEAEPAGSDPNAADASAADFALHDIVIDESFDPSPDDAYAAFDFYHFEVVHADDHGGLVELTMLYPDGCSERFVFVWEFPQDIGGLDAGDHFEIELDTQPSTPVDECSWGPHTFPEFSAGASSGSFLPAVLIARFGDVIDPHYTRSEASQFHRSISSDTPGVWNTATVPIEVHPSAAGDVYRDQNMLFFWLQIHTVPAPRHGYGSLSIYYVYERTDNP